MLRIIKSPHKLIPCFDVLYSFYLYDQPFIHSGSKVLLHLVILSLMNIRLNLAQDKVVTWVSWLLKCVPRQRQNCCQNLCFLETPAWTKTKKLKFVLPIIITTIIISAFNSKECLCASVIKKKLF